MSQSKWILVLVLLVAASGCSSGLSARKYNASMREVGIGMTEKDFLAIFPNAERRGAKAYSTGSVTVLELQVSQYSFLGTDNPGYNRNELTGMESKLTWFYFFNDKLVQYGMPNDWPRNPDQIIEIRDR